VGKGYTGTFDTLHLAEAIPDSPRRDFLNGDPSSLEPGDNLGAQARHGQRDPVGNEGPLQVVPPGREEGYFADRRPDPEADDSNHLERRQVLVHHLHKGIERPGDGPPGMWPGRIVALRRVLPQILDQLAYEMRVSRRHDVLDE
jgi:hypothetical protein